MALLTPLVVFVYFSLYALAFSIPPLPPIPKFAAASYHHERTQKPLRETLDEWLEKEERIALQKLRANVAPGGRNVAGAVKGSVIASPSKEHPNYFYQCEF